MIVDRAVRRVLVWRQGTLGDTIVALPSLHLVARAFPQAERRLLSDQITNANIAPAARLLLEPGLVHGVVAYPSQTRAPSALAGVARAVRAFAPEVVVYLVEGRTWRQRVRDRAFLRLCGVRRVIGAGLFDDASRNRILGDGPLVEAEAKRLARSLAALGRMPLDADTSWDLGLTAAEHAAAAAALAPLGGTPFVAFSLGTKWQPNDYTDDNWRRVLARAGERCAGIALVAFGAPNEQVRSADVLATWPGETLNLCGALAVRESAAALTQALAFAGHDSGPMHMAAAVAVPCVCVFSGRNPPGQWYPRGAGHTIFYNDVSCAPCGLTVCRAEGKRCILSVPAREVGDALAATSNAALARRAASARPTARRRDGAAVRGRSIERAVAGR